MAWWVWLLAGWSTAALVAGLVAGMAAADISRQEKVEATVRPLLLGGRGRLGTGSSDPTSSGAQAAHPLPGGPRRRLRPRPAACRPRPPRPGVTARTRQPVGSAGGRPRAADARQGSPSSARAASTRRRPGLSVTVRLSPTRPPVRHRLRSALWVSRAGAGDATGRTGADRRQRATPVAPGAAGTAVPPPSPRRVRTPPPTGSRVHLLTGRRLQRVLTVAALPMVALMPALAGSASALGKDTALDAEIAAHPDQTADLIQALDRGRVLAGLSTPVTAPAPSADAPPAEPQSVPSVRGSDDADEASTTSPRTGATGTAPTSPVLPTSPSVAPSTSAGPTPTRSSADEAPTPTTGQGTPRPTRPSDDVPPTSAAPTRSTPTTSAPATPTPTPTPSATPAPTPAPTTPTAPQPTAPPVAEPTPTSSAPPAPGTSTPPVRTGEVGSSSGAPSGTP